MESKIFIYNSLTRKKEEFIPLEPKKVKMYVCGPTVYDEPHIGHARSAYIFDVIRRYFTFRGYDVEFVRNVTDVDDKIINKARDEFPKEDLNSSFKKVSEKYLSSYHEALKELDIETAEIKEPKASDYIPKMMTFIQELIDKGAAYVSGGDVYFDIKKAKDYGKLSHQAVEKMEAGSRVSPGEKKNDALDFALWKSVKPGEPSWNSPWGKGRPGWHIECSVMSSDILGDEFDIHGGGIDLIFPHHENEIAQSEGAGKRFARYWMHHGLLTINGQKMSKSLGNFVTVKDFLDKYHNADLLKLLFLATHYSHPVDYTHEKIGEVKQALERINILSDKLARLPVKNRPAQAPEELEEIRDKFIRAMDDDFNTPQALATIFDLVNIVNKRIDEQDFASCAAVLLKELTVVFGIGLKKEADLDLPGENIDALIQQRNEARKNKDFKRSDEIRKELEAKGIILEDTKEGTTWRRKL
ncbi:MAG: cysteine--tRNA ligase [Candidatus Omnitrophica bacterium]|nr:cysteine--tRNA ligase [Candidatus Omnitrophota bacterium]